MTGTTSALALEWATLQNNFEQADRTALGLKLAAIVLWLGGYALGLPCALLAGTALLLWVQESLCRTSQARLGERILRVEALVKTAAPGTEPTGQACQLHTEWLASRRGSLGLLAEYGRHALRPTVAFPYAVLAAASLLCL